MKNIFSIAFLTLLFVGQSLAQSGQDSHLLSPTDFAAKLKATPNAILLDVRTPDEFAEGHLAKAINYDWYGKNFAAQVAKLDKSKPVFVYCYGGGRSSEAVEHLQEKGFKVVYDMKGGIQKWRKAHLPETK